MNYKIEYDFGKSKDLVTIGFFSPAPVSAPMKPVQQASMQTKINAAATSGASNKGGLGGQYGGDVKLNPLTINQTALNSPE